MSTLTSAVSGTLDSKTFGLIRDLVYEKSGIVLKDDKATLVAGRLTRRLRELGLQSAREYVAHLERDATGLEMTQLLDAISTNVTSFFREADHFEFVRGVFKRWYGERQRRFRVWCAAASSGEEPYTIAMSLLSLGLAQVDLRILATDISTAVLSRAIDGVYPAKAVSAIPRPLLGRYFAAQQSGADVEYVATEELRKPLLFRYLNLAELPLPLHGPLDMILCRNVMIYFDQGLRGRLIAEFYRLLKPGGYLVISHSESLVGLESSFKMLQPSVHMKPGPEAESAV
jgi:chemotaxis protein methyltransferase CheR